MTRRFRKPTSERDLLRRCRQNCVYLQGFYPCFPWIIEKYTRFGRDMIEEALSHTVTSEIEESYRQEVRGVDVQL